MRKFRAPYHQVVHRLGSVYHFAYFDWLAYFKAKVGGFRLSAFLLINALVATFTTERVLLIQTARGVFLYRCRLAAGVF